MTSEETQRYNALDSEINACRVAGQWEQANSLLKQQRSIGVARVVFMLGQAGTGARTYAALESRAKERKSTDGRAYGYRDGKVGRGEAFIVQQIFGKFADGIHVRAIAVDLNARRIPSPGSTWNRTMRCANGWMGSSIRVILRNERYRGVIHWNMSEWRRIRTPASASASRGRRVSGSRAPTRACASCRTSSSRVPNR
jgi:hypothetical protein